MHVVLMASVRPCRLLGTTLCGSYLVEKAVSPARNGAAQLFCISGVCWRRCTFPRSPESSGAVLSCAQMEDAYAHFRKQ